MLFSSLPLPFEKPPVLKYTPIPRPPVAPRISTYVPCRPPSPEPDVHLEDPPAIPAELSNCGLVMYGYLIDDKFCKEKGFADSMDASDDIGACIDKLRISAFVKMATFPGNDDVELFYFALRDTGGPVYTEGERGVPAIKMKELEAIKSLKPACWISFDEVAQRRSQ
ncbi:hypothetical protein BDZ89DRAFT_1077955 [Hymenopellis radicata]|nr:hypothetical protein BDZ89DRAFT_1077955 [Hymenopellis radicata]